MSIRTSEILAKLLGSTNRIKIIRLFLLNQDEVFSLKEISKRAKISPEKARREVNLLSSIRFIEKKRKLRRPDREVRRGSESRPQRASGNKIQGWKLNKSFSLLIGLRNFILDTAPIARGQLLKKLQKTGRVKLVILAGIFGEEDSSRVDILVVGDAIRKGALERVIRDIEAEVGKELIYAFFTTDDFMYRLGMYDKFIRDILDYPHEKILDKLGI